MCVLGGSVCVLGGSVCVLGRSVCGGGLVGVYVCKYVLTCLLFRSNIMSLLKALWQRGDCRESILKSCGTVTFQVSVCVCVCVCVCVHVHSLLYIFTLCVSVSTCQEHICPSRVDLSCPCSVC